MRYYLGQIPSGCQVMPDGSVYCEWQAEGGQPVSSITEAGMMPPGGGGALPPGFGPPLPGGGGALPVGGGALPVGGGFGLPLGADFGMPVDIVAVDEGAFPGFFVPSGQGPVTAPETFRPGETPEGLPPLEEGAPIAGRLAAVGGFGAAVLAALALGGTLG